MTDEMWRVEWRPSASVLWRLIGTRATEDPADALARITRTRLGGYVRVVPPTAATP